MDVKEVLPSVYHVYFAKQKDMAKTFLRFSEYGESPEFKGKIFTLEEFSEWYVEHYEAEKFTYYEDWLGFNVPSYILTPFYDGKFDPLSDREKKLLKTFEDKREEIFYIVGTYGESEEYKHELAHALFAINPYYRMDVISTMKQLTGEENKSLEDFLDDKGYHPDVYQDEIHAYLIDNMPGFKEDKIATENMERISKKINQWFSVYSKLNLDSKL